MTMAAHPSFAQWYAEGPRAPFLHTLKCSGGLLNMLETAQPPGDMSVPAVPDLVLHQDLLGGTRFNANHGGGRFSGTTEKDGLYPAAPDFALMSQVATPHRLRSFAFPIAQWQWVLDSANTRRLSFDSLDIFRGNQATPALRSALANLWSLSVTEGGPSRLLVRAAGCEILAELCRSGGAPFAPAKGGLAPWAERRCLEILRERLAEDISLDELAAEAKLSPFHFARMFKQSIGVPPRVYLTRLRVQKACELLEHTDLSVRQIALKVGYSSNQVLARVFAKHRHINPTEYRKAVRIPDRAIAVLEQARAWFLTRG